jgi:hypothetical protein
MPHQALALYQSTDVPQASSLTHHPGALTGASMHYLQFCLSDIVQAVCSGILVVLPGSFGKHTDRLVVLALETQVWRLALALVVLLVSHVLLQFCYFQHASCICWHCNLAIATGEQVKGVTSLGATG